MTTTPAMPELPEPDRTMWQHGKQIDHYTADQMRAYALATLQSQPAEVSDEAIDYAVLQAVGFDGLGTQEMNQFDCRHIDRAILALRPQAVPMTEELANEFAREMVKGHKSVEWLVRKVEAHHGITAPAGGEG